MENSIASIQPKSKKKTIAIVVVVLVVFAALFVCMLLMYQSESQAVVTELKQDSAQVTISVRTYSVDPVKGETAMRLQFDPNDGLLTDGVLSKDTILDFNSATGKTTLTFKKGERMSPQDITLDTYGNVGAYPFDTHEAVPYFMLYSSEKADGSDTQEYTPIPFTIDYSSTAPGYRIDASEQEGKEPGYVPMDLMISRSASATVFAIFIMALELLLAFSAAVVLYVWLRGRKIEVSMFGWMGALLFALVPLRNAMPAVPPIGVLSDFISFFWAEIIVAVSLAIGVLTWFKRGSVDGNPK
jgi:hypothetical protein